MELSTFWQFCQNCAVDIVVFVSVEIFTRKIFPKKSSKVVLLSSQLSFLAIAWVILFLHHPPYLLALFGFLVLCALLWSSSNSKQQNEFVSKPLPNVTAGKFVDACSREPIHCQDHALALGTTDYQFMASASQFDSTLSKPSSTTALSRTPLNKKESSGSNLLLRRPSIKRTTTSTPSSKSPSRVPPLSYFGSLFATKRLNTHPPGLVNSGNTCFVNSTLQCLTWLPEFAENFILIVDQREENSQILSELLKLILSMREYSRIPKGHLPIETAHLLSLISDIAPHLVSSRTRFSYQTQQDSAEFLLWLLDYIHAETNKTFKTVSEIEILALEQSKKSCLMDLSKMKTTDKQFNAKVLDYSAIEWHLNSTRSNSIIYKQFLGQLLEARECQLCNKVSLNIEYFTVLPLPLPSPSTSKEMYSLDNCFNLFSEVEDLVNTNMITCTCIIPNEQSFTPGKRRALVSVTPQNLVIQLLRYTYKPSLQTTVKNNVCVKFGTTLSLPISTESALGNNASHKQAEYELTGVCVHSGAENTSNGHYVAYSHTPSGWCYFNDESVEEISDIDTELQGYFILKNAYLLFYTKIR